MRIRPAGTRALLLEVTEPAAWFAALQRLRQAGQLDVREIVPGAATVLLDGVNDIPATRSLLKRCQPTAGADDTSTALISLDIEFDGPDLATVAGHWHCTQPAVIDTLTSTEFRAAFCGFIPGWAYLAGLPDERRLPRLRTPRTRVPAGSLALADQYAGIYPTDSPGGWLIVGHTDARLFDPHAQPPALLSPGTRVRLRESTRLVKDRTERQAAGPTASTS